MGTSSAQTEEKKERNREIRVSHPKVRTGCITCKIRRLKCDETKPECLRCIRFEGHCDGYPLPKDKRSTSRDNASSKTTNYPSRKLIPLVPKYIPNLIRSFDDRVNFRNEQEHLAFLAFKGMTSDEQCGIYQNDFWRIVFQGSQKNDFIRDAVIALGALMSCERGLVQDAENRTSRAPFQSTPRYQYSLKQYGRALKRMREEASCSEHGLRSMLIGCILVVCFEAVMGNHVKALAHAVSGHNILRSWLTSRADSESSSLTSKEMASPAEHIIEDELVHTLSRLDLQIVTYQVDPRPAETHKELQAEGTQTVCNMPSSFSSLKEARMYLDLVQRRTWHFVHMVEDERYRDVGAVKLDFPITKNVTTLSLADWGDGHGMSDEYLMHSGEVLRWQSAFRRLYSSLLRSSNAWKAASLLQIESVTTKVGLDSTLNREECDWDRFIPDFRWIISLAKEVFDEEVLRRWLGFSFEGGIIKPLWMVAGKCRHPTIRRDAIALMRKTAAKELLWDALLHASACEAQMLSEEEGMDENGFIPESERFKITGGTIDGFRRIGTITFRKVGKKEDGTVDERIFTSTF